jgi:hypothetical protein
MMKVLRCKNFIYKVLRCKILFTNLIYRRKSNNCITILKQENGLLKTNYWDHIKFLKGKKEEEALMISHSSIMQCAVEKVQDIFILVSQYDNGKLDADNLA